jgi:hypothetical protein
MVIKIILFFLFFLFFGSNQFIRLQQLDEINLCEDSNFQDICENNKNISRINMPQLSKKIQDQYAAMKGSEYLLINPNDLYPTQSEISAVKVSGMIGSNPNACSDPDLAILVARDNKTKRMYIIDGHHRYATCRIMNQSIIAIVISGEVFDIINELKTLSGIDYRTIDQ